jgi:hypothetical protein
MEATASANIIVERVPGTEAWRIGFEAKVVARFALVCIGTLVIASPTFADVNLYKHLAAPPVAVLTSSKAPEQIELCAADAIGQSFLPVPYSDGNGGVLLFGFAGMMGAGTVHRIVSLIKTATGTRIELRTYASQPDEKLAVRLRSCA